MEDIDFIVDNIIESVLNNFVSYPYYDIGFVFDTDKMRELLTDHIHGTSTLI